MWLFSTQRGKRTFLLGLSTPGESNTSRLEARVFKFAYQCNKKKHIHCLDDWEIFYWKQIKLDNQGMKWPHTILFPWIEHLYFYCITTVKQLFLLQEATGFGSRGERRHGADGQYGENEEYFQNLSCP